MGKYTKPIVLIFGLLLTLGIVLIAGDRIYNLLAKAGNSSPENVQITAVTSNSATITFTTAEAVQALLEYGTDASNLTLFASDTETTSHSIVLSLLTPTTTYYFQIKIGDKTYDNAGVPWTFTTSGANTLLPSPTLGIQSSPTPGGGGQIPCNEVAKRMGAVPASPNYQISYDLNSDGIINSADLALCAP
ncbi:hypothetical protein HY407_01980 [Candidatus Gottesmanbacteria bacterium]|nr:hypothetical protein [Candidatus Gottesmanbacteria bacterium]